MNLNHLYHYHYRPKSYGDQGIDVSGLDYVWATTRAFVDNKTGPILTIEDSLGNTTVLNGDDNGNIQISDLEAAYAVGGELRVRTFHELKGTGADATDATFSRQAVLVEANGDVNYLNGAFAPLFKTTNHLYNTSTNIGGQPGLFTTFIGQADFSATGNLCPIGALTFNWMRIEADGDVNMRIRDRDLGGVVILDTLENNFTVGDQQFSGYLSNRGNSLRMYSNGLTSSVDSSTALEVTDANLYIGSRGADQFLGHGVFWGAKDGEYNEEATLMAALNRYYFGGVWDDTGIWDDTGVWDGGIELPHPDDLNVAPTFVGLLDTYSGAAAAYSTRQLKLSSTLSMRVRRSSDDTEQDIGFDSNGDLDTTALTTFVNADVTKADTDFSTDTSGTSESGLDRLANQSIGERSGVLKATIQATTEEHRLIISGVNTGGKTHRLQTSVYIPSGQSGQTVDGFRIENGGLEVYATTTTKDAWVDIDVTWSSSSNANLFIKFLPSGGAENWTGNGTDEVYIGDVTITQTTADGAVTTFYDQTGNGNDATNSTESEQPLVVSGGTLVEENGKAAISPTDRSNYFTMNPLSLTSDTWVFSALKNPLNQTTAFIEGDNSNEFLLITSASSTSTLINNDYTSVSFYKDGAPFSPTTRQDAYNGLTSQSLLTSSFDGSISTFINLGYPSSALIGMFQIQELIIFDSDQSGNRTGIETNINDHFDIYP